MPPMLPASTRPAWDSDALRDPHAQPDKAVRVEAMFDAIAPTYERVNTVATFGRDAAWRRRTVAAADVRPTDVVLDICYLVFKSEDLVKLRFLSLVMILCNYPYQSIY